MYLKDILPNHTYTMGEGRHAFTFTVYRVGYEKGQPVVVDTMPFEGHKSGTRFYRPGLTMVTEVA